MSAQVKLGAAALIAPPDPERIAFPHARQLRSRDVFRLAARAWPFIRPYKRHLAYLFLTIIPSLPAGLIGLTMIRIFFDVVGHGDPIRPAEAWLLRVPLDASRELILRHACVLTGIVAMLAMPLAALTIGYAVWILQRISNLFRVNLYTRMQELSVQFHSQEKIGDAIFRMFQDSAPIPEVIDGLVIQPMRAIPMVIGVVIWLMICDYRMGLIAIALIPANWLLAWRFAGPLRHAFIAEREATAQATTRIEETLASIKAVKAFGTEASEAALYGRDNWNAFMASRRSRLMLARYRVASNTIRGLAYAGAVYFGARDVMAGGAVGLAHAALSLGVFQGAILAFGAVSARIRGLTDRWGSMQDVVVAISRVLEMLAKPPEHAAVRGHKLPPRAASVISFDSVSFGYDPLTTVLREVSFQARAGEITALAGASGSGKSTIIALIVRFFDPSNGHIRLDGESIDQFDLPAWRGMLSVALQENPMFTATIRDNVAYGRPEASAEEVREALERAGLGEFVRSLPMGLDTVLGEKGAKISTGQAQRIGLARALVRNAPILLLDEPTSALDGATENHVMQGLREWVDADPKHRIVIVATHRRTTAARADRSYQIAAGRVLPADLSALEEGEARDA